MPTIKNYLMNIERLKTFQVFIFYLVLAFAFHIDRFILRSYALFKTHDQFDGIWPWQQALAARIVNFQMPGWFPDYLGGMPFFMSDTNWLFAPMILSSPFSDHWNLTAVTMIYFMIAGFGTYLFLQYFLRASRSASILGGLVFALGTVTLTYWRIFELTPIPMLIYCTDRIVFAQGKREKLLLLLGMVICATSMMIAKGVPFIALFQLFLILFFHRRWNQRIRALISYGFLWVFVAVVNLPLIISLLKNTAASSRSFLQWPVLEFSLSGLFHNVILFVLDPFITSYLPLGVLGVLIVLYSFFNFKQWDRLGKAIFFYYVAVLFVVTFVIYSSWFLSIWMQLPIATFRLGRLIVVGPFILMAIAFANFDSFLVFIRGPFIRVILLTIVCIIVTGRKYLIIDQFPSNYIELAIILLFSGLFLIFVFLIKEKNLKTNVVIALFVSLFFAERFLQINLIRPLDYHPPSITHFFKSELFDKFRPPHKYDYRIGFINYPSPSAGLYNDYQVAGGYGTYLRRYAIFWNSVVTEKRDSAAFQSYFHKAYLHDTKVLRDAHPPNVIKKITFNVDLLALHNVRYIFSLNEIEDPPRWGLTLAHEGTPQDRAPGLKRLTQVLGRIFEPMPYYVYEIVDYHPRVFLAKGAELVKDESGMADYLGSKNSGALRDTVVYNRQDLDPEQLALLASMQRGDAVRAPSEQKNTGTAQIIFYSDNKIVIDAKSDAPQQLVLIENYFRDWTATINGHPSPLFPAYGTFRSVILNAGDNLVTFSFRPPYLIRSLWISGLGSLAFIGFGICWALINRKPRERKITR